MNRIGILKLLDRIIGTPLVMLIAGRARPRGDRINRAGKILLIRPGGIGDAVLLLPSLHALRTKYPGPEIHVLCEKRNADIFRLTGDVDRLYLYDRGTDLFTCIRNTYDVVIDTEQWHRLSAAVAGLTGAAVRVGFATNERSRLFTQGISYSQDDYEAESFLRLVEPLAGKGPGFNPDEPFLTLSDELTVRMLPQAVRGIPRSTLISVFPGGSVRERRWGGDRFGAVAEEFSGRGYTLVILGSRADRAEAERIKKYSSGAIDLTGRTGLGEAAAVLTRSGVFLTGDSGLMHLAYAVGTPTVSLFGPGIQEKWAPRGRGHRVLNKRIPCSPCTKFGYTPDCRKGGECLRSIGTDEVISAMSEVLGDV